ncbi:unnamed protein product [Microthlaspi erraticum]|uniref:Uncharacterized protein n=1 Tax=Microthlaspi erraticum TaxID=1685480 RepID=A0A6D2IKA1_9BRAS|nr:unnamed protein product [Microthlaspi erraticum]
MKMMWRLCLIFSLFNSVFGSASLVRHLCRPDQKDALLEFTSEFHFDRTAAGQIATWRNKTDCCSWDGISCDDNTGMVIELDLNCFGFWVSCLSGPLRSKSSLFRLQHLQSLDLRRNRFFSVLPDSIGNLKYLRVLKLGECNLFGKIPSSIGNLSYLTDLDLSQNDFTGELLDSIGNLKYLRVLNFSNCNLFGKIPSSIGNLSYLTDLDLSYNNDFTGELPDSMGNLNRLKKMELGYNKLGGNFPLPLLNLTELTFIYLGSNLFKGMLPSNMSSLSKLEVFYIDGNSFHGSVPSSLLMIPSLTNLDLGTNHFNGTLDIGGISSPSKLERLILGDNNFSGPIPVSISKLVGLQYLDLSFWNTGRGLVDFNIFLHLKSLEDLALSSCNISEFPKFIQNQTRLRSLDISTNRIEGQVPEWLWSLPELEYVNISQNSFSGFEGSADVIQKSDNLFLLDISSNNFQDLPLLPKSLNHFLGSENGFSGEIPVAICELFVLGTLVLSNNNFSGSIPRCSENFTLLWVLHLRNNSLSGILPEEAIGGVHLKSLDVGGNKLLGELPKSLINRTSLEFLNVEDNNFNDTFPFHLGLLPDLQILVLRSNEFHGPLSSPGDSLSFPKLRIFDISENRFTGVLPSDYFAGWDAMSSLVDYRIRFDYLSESYHKSVGLTNKGLKMELVGSVFTMYKTIDVSGNRFQGDIPESIGLLKELIVLNMSNNAFTGRIPPSLGT